MAASAETIKPGLNFEFYGENAVVQRFISKTKRWRVRIGDIVKKFTEEELLTTMQRGAEDLEGKFPRGCEPKEGRFHGFHSVEFYCSNAKQISDYYCMRFGFRKVAERGLMSGEGNNREFASHVLVQGDLKQANRRNPIYFVFTSILKPASSATSDHAKWLATRGDSVRDVAFVCTNVKGLHKKAVARGAKSKMEPQKVFGAKGDGFVWMAKLETYGECIHTLIDASKYKGAFLPGFQACSSEDPVFDSLPPVGLQFIDHIVGNQAKYGMISAAEWYAKHLDFHRFWSVDDKQMHTKYSALRSIVMADWHETIKMPLNEPAKAKRKSQIQEYVEYHGGPGVQHIALNTPDILTAISALRARGVKFLRVPDTYYEDLRKRLIAADGALGWDIKPLQKDLDKVQALNILIDFDDQGYLLQLFTEPVEDRPTLFFEIIQRMGNQGFGVGNFKSLFEAIERAQDERGNLTLEEGTKV